MYLPLTQVQGRVIRLGVHAAPNDGSGLHTATLEVATDASSTTVLQYGLTRAICVVVTCTAVPSVDGAPASACTVVVSPAGPPQYAIVNATPWPLMLEQHVVPPAAERHVHDAPTTGPWYARLRVAPDGNWTEALDCTRVRHVHVPLYTAAGSRSLACHFSRRGPTNQVLLEVAASGPPPLLHSASSRSVMRTHSVITVTPVALKVTLGVALCVVLQQPRLTVSTVAATTALALGVDHLRVRNLIGGANYPLLLSSRDSALSLRARVNHTTGHVSSVALVVPELLLQLDFESTLQIARQLAELNSAPPREITGAVLSGAASPPLFVDAAEVSACAVTLTWQNPRPLFPLPPALVPDSALLIRDAVLSVPAIAWDGPYSLAVGPLLRQVVLPALQHSLVQHTLAIIGALDIVGSPTAALQSLQSSLRAFGAAGTAALLGRPSDALSRALDGALALVRAPLLPLWGLSNAAGRLLDYSRVWVGVATAAQQWGAPVAAVLDFYSALNAALEDLLRGDGDGEQ